MRAPRMTTDYTASELQPGSNGKCGHPEPDLERGLLKIARLIPSTMHVSLDVSHLEARCASQPARALDPTRHGE